MKIIIPGTDVTIRAKIETFNDRIVKCTLYDDNQSLSEFDMDNKFVGIAKCHPDDKFDKIIGVEIAIGKALERRSRVYILIIHKIRSVLGMELHQGNKLIRNKINKKFKRK